MITQPWHEKKNRYDTRFPVKSWYAVEVGEAPTDTACEKCLLPIKIGEDLIRIERLRDSRAIWVCHFCSQKSHKELFGK